MTDLLPFLKNLLSAPGLCGYEAAVRPLIEAAWQPLTDELHVSRLGSLHGLRRGTLPDQPRPSLLLAAHMDAIGMMVTGIVDGWLRITDIGGIDPRILPGQLVTVHGHGSAGAQDLPGMVVVPPTHLLPEKVRGKVTPIEYLLVDTGLPAPEAARRVRVGDLVSFAQPPVELAGDSLVGHSLDDRAAVAVLTDCLQELQGRSIAWDVWAVATVQEEETLGGAFTSAFQLQPSLAVAVDVTFGTGPGSPAYKTYPLGKGPTLGWGPNVHPAFFQAFKELADRLEIPYKLEVMPTHSGTDAIGMQVTAAGIPCMVLGIPLRYMHTPVEVVCMKDILRAGRLLAEFILHLDDQFLAKLHWED